MKNIFDEENFYLLIHVEEGETNTKKFECEDYKEYRKKSEFHITIIGFYGGEVIKNVIASMPLDARTTTNRKIRDLVERTDWNYCPIDTYCHISKDYENGKRSESIIQLVEVPNLREFYNNLNALLDTNLHITVPHVTLFTKGNHEKSHMGIGINSSEEFLALEPKLI